jgi:hypothetical protein
VPVLVMQWRRLRLNLIIGDRHDNPLMVRYAAGYLSVMAVLWLTALPAHLDAVGGLTANGDPVGSLWYTAACFTVAALCVAAAATLPPILPDAPEPAEQVPAAS